MNVLSLFDGISGARVALERAGFHIDNYFSSEIDKYAIAITDKNYPDTKQLGDITKVKGDDLPEIDLIVGGSPCQGFSMMGGRLQFDDFRSKLFFEYVRLLDECNPRYFLLENVPMEKFSEQVISKSVKAMPMMICSSLLSAQRRRRLYWTNIPNVGQPQDEGIPLKSVLEIDVREPMYSNLHGGFGENKPRVHYGKSVTLQTSSPPYMTKVKDDYYLTEKEKGHVTAPMRLRKQYTAINGENSLPLLTGNSSGTHIDEKYYLSEKMVKNIMADKFNNKPELNPEVAKPLLATMHKMHRAGVDNYIKGDFAPEGKTSIRRLLPVEAERLQTYPDDYTKQGIMDGKVVTISDTQRYKALGNSYTCSVIAHILSSMKGNPEPKGKVEQLELFPVIDELKN